MRALLTVILIFVTTTLCFALQPEPAQPAFHSANKIKTTAIARFLSQQPVDDTSSLNKDEFEQATLIRQFVKKQGVSSIQLFHIAADKTAQHTIRQTYIANANSSYNFIYHFLYPKHVFW